MTSDDKLRQVMMTSDSRRDPMEVFESDTRENYNKVVFKKNITVALLPTNGNDNNREKEGKRNR